MRSLEIKPYEISLWQDENVYIVRTNTGNNATYTEYINTPPVLLNNQTITNNFNREVKIAVIGSDTMDTPIRAFSPVFQQKVNGENILTFQMFYHYYDEQTGSLELNPFRNLLTNERKIKLFYDEEWYDLIIKSIQENKDTHVFTYTCKDQYITELSKNGYELIFDTELENNMGTITELGARILEGSDWEINEKESDKIPSYINEALFTYELSQNISGTVLRDFTYKDNTWNKGDSYTIDSGSIIFVSYSSYMNQDISMQFFSPLVTSNGESFICDDNGTILNAPSLSAGWPNNVIPENLKVTSNYKGNVLSTIKPTTYCELLDKFVYSYTKDNYDYYAWAENEFAAETEIQELLTNNNNFTSIEGWIGQEGNNESVLINTITKTREVASDIETIQCLQIGFKDGLAAINTGLYDNRAFYSETGFITEDSLIFGVKPFDNSQSNAITNVQLIYQRVGQSGVIEERNLINVVQYFTEDERLSGWQLFKLTFRESLSYNEIIEGNLQLRIFGGNNAYILEDCKLFKELYDANGKLIIPSMETATESIVRTKYYFFRKNLLNNITNKDQIIYSFVYYEQDIPSSFILTENETFEKVTSIHASKSNRFNLIQNLCETFEVWAKFNIQHNDNGEIFREYILTEDTFPQNGKYYYQLRAGASSGSQLDRDYEIRDFDPRLNLYERKTYKEVVFKEYVGAENDIGFRYGINLKSIQRSLDSSQIISKLIVEPNANEFADNGSCSIQYSSINPTGENIIYNWDYFFNHNLLDKDGLYYDLYDTNGIGFFVNLANWNREIYPIISMSANIGVTLSKLYSQKTIYETLIQESTTLRDEYQYNLNNAKALVGDVTETLTPTGQNDTIKEWKKQLEIANTNINRYNKELEDLNTLITNYETQYNGYKIILDANAERKNDLFLKFYKKYSRFIQEGSWTSEDYYDSDLYYTDASKVLYSSAFPQVNYTIDVFELSQVEGFEPYQFKIGDRSYIEDTEFFGYVPNSGGRPYQEEIVVSEVTYNLDDPSQNKIKVQNYKTQFEDLFQRINAATQSLQFYEGKYQRSANAIEDNGTISGSVLEKTLNYNNVLADAMAKEIESGGQSIKMQSVTQANRFLQITALGIQLSKDGGVTWDTAISGDGINADVGVYGRLHTNRLSIYGGDSETFMWDAYGLNAYSWDPNSSNVYYNKFVRLDRFGLYGYMGNQASEYHPNSINDIEQNAVFSLTWNGLNINALNGTNYVKISTNTEPPSGEKKKIIWAGTRDNGGNDIDNFVVYEDGSILANDGTFTGNIKAQGLFLPSGSSFVSILDTNNKINGSYINAAGISVTIEGVTIGLEAAVANALDQSTSAYDRLEALRNGTLGNGTFIGAGAIYSPEIYSGTFYAARSGSGTYARMDDHSFKIFESDSSVYPKIELSISQQSSDNSTYYYPNLFLGVGSGSADSRGLVKKLRDGIWIGNSDAQGSTDQNSIPSTANGMFVNFDGPITFYGDTVGSIARFG